MSPLRASSPVTHHLVLSLRPQRIIGSTTQRCGARGALWALGPVGWDRWRRQEPPAVTAGSGRGLDNEGGAPRSVPSRLPGPAVGKAGLPASSPRPFQRAPQLASLSGIEFSLPETSPEPLPGETAQRPRRERPGEQTRAAAVPPRPGRLGNRSWEGAGFAPAQLRVEWTLLC